MPKINLNLGLNGKTIKFDSESSKSMNDQVEAGRLFDGEATK